jgi:hypothetical protein
LINIGDSKPRLRQKADGRWQVTNALWPTSFELECAFDWCERQNKVAKRFEVINANYKGFKIRHELPSIFK